MTHQECTDRAREVLMGNDRGTFTVPTDRLYPHQWNWDSAFVALGWQAIDEKRAWVEVRTLLEQQWPNGMVPHIIYHSPAASYFPDLAWWGGTPHKNSSGFTQNPVAASCVLRLLNRARDTAYARSEARALVHRIAAWHRWFFEHRRDDASGLIAIAHPWESRDNACDWDAPLAAMKLHHTPEYTRKDLLLVPVEQRPTGEHYAQFLSIIEVGKSVSWQLTKSNARFWVADPFFMAILIAAEHDLIQIANLCEEGGVAAEAAERRRALVDAFEQLWDSQSASYRAYDLLHNERATSVDIGTFLPLYARIPSAARAAELIALLEEWLAAVRYGVPSHDPRDARFEAQRYWRGPVWLVVNFLIAEGLRHYGRADLAHTIEAGSRALVQNSGFRESFNPLDGTGSGGDCFSWTAAMWLGWLAK